MANDVQTSGIAGVEALIKSAGKVTKHDEQADVDFAALEERFAEACTALKVAPDALQCETPSRLDLIREKATERKNASTP